MPLDPWHMWGTSLPYNIIAGSNPGLQGTVQLAKINYARPENWRFLFVAEIKNDLLITNTITVQFHIIAGVGRSSSLISPFATILFSGPVSANTIIWRTQVIEPDVSAAAPPPPPTFTDHIVAQDLQCYATVSSNAGTNILLIASAYFAPNVHIRPEWYDSDGPQFKGNENNGA